MRYVLEGSVRRVGETITINAQLISTETGAHVWADRFEGERGKLGELQVEAAARVANSLGVELVKAEALRAMREGPSNPDAVDLAMQAEYKANLPDSKATMSDAVTLAERALALDPQNVRALLALTNALLSRVIDRWSDDPAGDLARAEKTVDAALALQPDNMWGHFHKGVIYYAKRQFGPSITENETVIALDPNNAFAYAFASFQKVYLGRAEDGFAGVETAFRLSPRDPQAFWWQMWTCALHEHLAQWEQAIPKACARPACRRARRRRIERGRPCVRPSRLATQSGRSALGRFDPFDKPSCNDSYLRVAVIPAFRRCRCRFDLLAIAYLSDQLGTGRSQLIAGAAGAWPQRTAVAPARSQQGALVARPRRLRVRYERAGRRLYSATAAGGARVRSPRRSGWCARAEADEIAKRRRQHMIRIAITAANAI